MNYPERLLGSFQQLSRLVLSHETVGSTLDVVSRLAVETMPACDVASVSLLRDREISTIGFSHEIAVSLDAIQYDTGEGPCLDAIAKEDRWFEIADMRNDSTWPAFSTRAAELGFHSLLAFPLRVDARTLGALNLYGYRVKAFAEEDRQYGAIYAAHASIALANAQTWALGAPTNRHLSEELVVREIIGRAVGILMEAEALSASAAHTLLERRAEELKHKVRDLAEEVISEADKRRASMQLPAGFADRLMNRLAGMPSIA